MIMAYAIANSQESQVESPVFSVEDYWLNPPDHKEWVDGQLVEKQG
ncbi:hypothetical protein [Coleofasciculus sp.]